MVNAKGWLLSASLILFALLKLSAQEQEFTDKVDKVIQFPDKLLSKLNGKASYVNDQLEKQTVKYLLRLEKQEAKLRRKLYKIDSLKAKQLGDVTDEYAELKNKLKEMPVSRVKAVGSNYLPYFDSLQGSFAFLEKNKQLLSDAEGIQQRLQSSLADINQLQARLQHSDQIKDFIKERQQQIKAVLNSYTTLPKGLTKNYHDFIKEVYYYQAQLKEYKAMLNDPDKIQQKVLELLRKVPAFTAFMEKHSILASMFTMPANYGTPAALAGLQTRSQVQQLVSNRLNAEGSNGQAMLQQNLQQAQSQLSQLKDKANQLGGGSSDIDMPDFKPNSQKARSFKDRIELGSNLQTVKSNRFFPTTTDIAASVGYKLNDKSVVGIGAAYKFGLGRDIRHIAFTSEGVGLRTFLDYKLKGSFWLTGGAEMNYRARFNSFEVLKSYSNWQQSALIGISKKYQVSKKVRGNAQILYDALWTQHVPRGQPVVFRIGYNIK